MTKFNCDYLIINVKVITGSGAPWFLSDVAIKDDIIVAIGQRLTTIWNSNKLIDGKKEYYLTPGFIDTHTHDDIEVLKHPSHPAKILQGVTTIVTGNCSFSNYPTHDGSLEMARHHIDAELGDIRSDEMFEDFNGYKKRLNEQGVVLNVVSLVGHGPLRLAIMGYEKRHANEEEIQRMCSLLDVQLQQGASGLSFGFVYPPSAFAGTEELIALSKVVANHDGIVAAHIRSYSGKIIESIEEFIDILRLSGAKGVLSHLQVAGKFPGKMKEAISLVEKARSDGVDLVFDIYPYKAGASSILQLLPSSTQEGGMEALLSKLSDPLLAETIESKIETGLPLEPGWESKVQQIGWENIFISSVSHETLKFSEGKSILKAAQELKIRPYEFMIDCVKKDFGTTCIIMFQQSDEDQKRVHESRLQMVGSDGVPRQEGKPHPRQYGSFPRVIGQMAMKDKVLDFEEAIRRTTSLPATRFHLYDRGLISLGMKADLVMFNDLIRDRATYEEPRLHPDGIIGVWVNGKQVVKDGLLIEDGKNRQEWRSGRVLSYTQSRK